MTISRRLTLSLVGASALGIAFATVIFLRLDVQGQRKEVESLRALPEIVLKVPRLELISAEIENAGKADAAAILQVWNKSDRSIIALALESGDQENSSGVTLNGIHDGNIPPSVIVGPFGVLKAAMPLSKMQPGFPLRISGVIYSDGNQVGEKETLEMMGRQFEKRKNLRRGE